MNTAKISPAFYKDIPGVCLEDQALRVTVLPEQGGKIASVYCKRSGRELLVQAPGTAYKKLDGNMPYIEGECSGFDDMFPTVDPCRMMEREYPDHGEICRKAWDWQARPEGLQLTVCGGVFPYGISKTLSLENGRFCLRYSLSGEIDRFPSLWAGHIMLNAAADDRVRFSFEDSIREMFRQGEIKPAVAEDGFALSHERANYKFYFEHPRDSWQAVLSRPDGSLVRLEAQGDCKWLGIWVDQAGFQDLFCVAFEPATAPYDLPRGCDGKKELHWELRIQTE